MSNPFRNAREPQTAPRDISSFPGEVLAQVPSSSCAELPPHNPFGKEKGSAATLGSKSLLWEAREAGWQCPSRQGTGDLLQKHPRAACHHAVIACPDPVQSRGIPPALPGCWRPWAGGGAISQVNHYNQKQRYVKV